NKGAGVFGQPSGGQFPFPWPDQIIYQPIPLEAAPTDSSVTAAPNGQTQGILDLDGDAFPDGVTGAGFGIFHVLHNNGSGGLGLYGSSSSFTIPTGSGDYLSSTLCTANGPCTPVTQQGLLDINGDGLPDHWTNYNGIGNAASVEWNDGVS